MGLMWFCLGFIAGFSVFIYNELWRTFKIDWKGWSGLLLGEVLVLFCVAWSVASTFEGEPRAASMGLICFGGPGVILLVLTWRLSIAKAATKS